jgi:histidinol-phosphate aminotransferase
MAAKLLRLNANEGRPCLGAETVASLIDGETLRRYPDSAPLEAALAARKGIAKERVLATAGADDSIDRAIRSFGRAGATVLSTAPAFEEYAAAAERSGARYVAVPRSPDGPFPLAGLVAAIGKERPALVVVCSPDSPGGGVIATSELRLLAEAALKVGARVLFDVAYSDFDEGRDIYDSALGIPGVIATGTFSKSYGLAGLRAGWAAGEAADIARLREAGPPFSLCTFSVAAALAALESGEEAKEAFVAQVKRERPRLQEALASIGARTWPSAANFVTAYVPDAAAFSSALAAEGIKIRSWAGGPGGDKPGRDGMIRITCPGEEGEFQYLLVALDKVGRLA